MARIISKKQATVDLSRVIVRDRIDVDFNLIDRWITDRNSLNELSINYLNFDFQENEFFIKFGNKYSFPIQIHQIITRIRDKLRLYQECNGYRLSVWKKCQPKPKQTFVIPRASIEVISRVVLVVGNKEMFEISISEKKIDHSENILCNSGDFFAVMIGANVAFSITFDNCTQIIRPPKDGFRNGIKISKHPMQRHVMVIDFTMDKVLIFTELTKEITSKNLSQTQTEEAINKLKDLFEIGENDNLENDVFSFIHDDEFQSFLESD